MQTVCFKPLNRLTTTRCHFPWPSVLVLFVIARVFWRKPDVRKKLTGSLHAHLAERATHSCSDLPFILESLDCSFSVSPTSTTVSNVLALMYCTRHSIPIRNIFPTLLLNIYPALFPLHHKLNCVFTPSIYLSSIWSSTHYDRSAKH